MSTSFTVVRAGRLLDGSGGRPLERAAVLIQGQRIVAVGPVDDPRLTPPPGSLVIDLGGDRTLLPGLIDCHVHPGLDGAPDHHIQLIEDSLPVYVLKGAYHLRRTLEGGVTAARAMGERSHSGPAWKMAVEKGIIPGPRLWVSGRILTIPGGHEDWHLAFEVPETQGLGRVVSGAEEARRAAREEIKAGADLIKLCATGGILSEGDEPGAQEMSLEEMAAAVGEAIRTGRRAAAHAQGAGGIKDAIRAGVRSIEHGLYLDDEAVEMMLRSGIYLVPTLLAMHRILEAGTEGGIPPYAMDKARVAADYQLQSFERAARAGVRIAMGTDAGTPFNRHGENLVEMELMVQAGMAPGEAIVSATSMAAELLGCDDIGRLAPGKFADLVAVGGDPLEDIRTCRRVVFVMKEGRVIMGPDDRPG